MKLFKSRGFTIGREEFAIGMFIEKEEFIEKFSPRHFELQVKSKFLIEADEKELALYEKKKGAIEVESIEVESIDIDDGRGAIVAELKELGVTDKEIGKKGIPNLTKMLEAKKAEAEKAEAEKAEAEAKKAEDESTDDNSSEELGLEE